MTTDQPRYAVTSETIITDPDDILIEPGITYRPDSKVIGITVTITDAVTGSFTRFHGLRDGDKPLFEFENGFTLGEIIKKANAYDALMSANTDTPNG